MLLLLFFLTGTARAEIIPLPTISARAFAPGRSWTWDYFDAKTKSLYSSETYSVISEEANGDVWIEMSSRLKGEKGFTPHQRMRVNVKQCLAIHQMPEPRSPWHIEIFYKNGGEWEASDLKADPFLFEEKFNCDGSWDTSSRRDVVESKVIPSGAIFRINRRRNPAASWYYRDGERAGVAAEREFDGRYFFRARH